MIGKECFDAARLGGARVPLDECASMCEGGATLPERPLGVDAKHIALFAKEPGWILELVFMKRSECSRGLRVDERLRAGQEFDFGRSRSLGYGCGRSAA